MPGYASHLAVTVALTGSARGPRPAPAREQQIYAGYAAALAALIAEQTRARPDDIAPWVGRTP
jgi:hypothetical protein